MGFLPARAVSPSPHNFSLCDTGTNKDDSNGASKDSTGASKDSRKLKVLTFNVLFPNSTPGVWWIYKYYNCEQKDMSTCEEKDMLVASVSAWPYRQKLLRKIIKDIDADVVCLQEAWSDRSVSKSKDNTAKSEDKSKDTAKSTEFKANPEDVVAQFYQDFAFMLSGDLGYETTILSKGIIRPATFWKPDVLKDVGTSHQYRVLVKCFQLLLPSSASSSNSGNSSTSGNSNNSSTILAIVNGHLPGGPVPDKRVSALADGLKAAEKLIKNASSAGGGSAANGPGVAQKKNQKGQQNAPDGKEKSEQNKSENKTSVIVCGDFNTTEDISYRTLLPGGGDNNSESKKSDSVNACDIFLTNTEITPDFIEDGIPVCSKPKKHPFAPFVDCSLQDSGAKATFVVAETCMRQSARLGGFKEDRAPMDSDNDLSYREQVEKHLTPLLIQVLRECFEKYASRLGETFSKESPSKLESQEQEIIISTTMDSEQVKKWQLDVNGEIGRGTGRVFFEERRKKWEEEQAKKENTSSDSEEYKETLTFDEFCYVYLQDVREGKFFQVEHDIRTMRNGKGMVHEVDEVAAQKDGEKKKDSERYFAARYDRIYLSNQGSNPGLKLASCDVLVPNRVKTTSEEEQGFCLPNAWHPSDHLPVVAEFQV